jgi:hypothetical protein
VLRRPFRELNLGERFGRATEYGRRQLGFVFEDENTVQCQGFAGFDPHEGLLDPPRGIWRPCSASLLNNPGIIRNKQKIGALPTMLSSHVGLLNLNG